MCDKIFVATNNNLQEQVLAIYHEKFVNSENTNRKVCRADEYFDISIGKTPPRKEPEWFSTNPDDVTWVSISDIPRMRSGVLFQKVIELCRCAQQCCRLYFQRIGDVIEHLKRKGFGYTRSLD